MLVHLPEDKPKDSEGEWPVTEISHQYQKEINTQLMEDPEDALSNTSSSKHQDITGQMILEPSLALIVVPFISPNKDDITVFVYSMAPSKPKEWTVSSTTMSNVSSNIARSKRISRDPSGRSLVLIEEDSAGKTLKVTLIGFKPPKPALAYAWLFDQSKILEGFSTTALQEGFMKEFCEFASQKVTDEVILASGKCSHPERSLPLPDFQGFECDLHTPGLPVNGNIPPPLPTEAAEEPDPNDTKPSLKP